MLSFNNEKGFSILELMVAISVMALLIGMAIPNFTQYNNNRKLEAAAQRVVYDMRLLRTIAIGQHHACKVEFDAENASYTMYIDENDNRGWVAYRTTELHDMFPDVVFERLESIDSTPVPVNDTNSVSFGTNGETWSGFNHVGTTIKSPTGPGLQSGCVFLKT